MSFLAVVELRYHNGTTEGSAELVQPERREGGSFGAEEVSRVHRGVSQEFEQAAMQLVRAGLRDHVNHRARVPADVGAIQVRLNLEFANCLNSGT